MESEKRKEFTLRISQSNKTQLLVITYEILLCYLDDIKLSFEMKNFTEVKDNVKKAQSCISQLMSSLDMKYPISYELLSIYLFINKSLSMVVIKKSIKEIENIPKIVGKLKDSFEEVSKADKSAPMMQNSQQVFAGLTYGKGYLQEVSGNEGENRGFLV